MTMPQQKDYLLRERFSFYGLLKAQLRQVYMVLICKGLSMKAVRDSRQCPMALSIQPSKGSSIRAGSTLMKVMPSEVEPKGSITDLPKKEKNSSQESINSFPVYESGNLRKTRETALVKRALGSSLILRWYTVPLVLMLGPEEQTWLAAMLNNRSMLARLGYSNSYLLVWDLGTACNFTLRYVLDSLSVLVP